MGFTVREGTPGDMGGGGKPGNNWHKFKAGSAVSIKEGKGGHKKDANEKKRKPWNDEGMKNRDGKQ